MRIQKKLFALVLAIVISFSGITVISTASFSATVAEPTDVVYPNGVVEYIVSVSGDTSLVGFENIINYNLDVVTVTDVQGFVEFPGGEFEYGNNDKYQNHVGRLYAADSAYYPVDVQAGQMLVKFIFKIKETTEVGNIILMDESEFYDGKYKIYDYSSEGLRPVSTFNIIDYGDPNYVEPTTEKPTTVPASTVEPITTVLIGDVNGDNAIDVLDAALVQKYAAGKAELTPEQLALADVNDDNNVDVLDAAMIQKYAAGKITEFKKKS